MIQAAVIRDPLPFAKEQHIHSVKINNVYQIHETLKRGKV